jgi:hypothetical protein
MDATECQHWIGFSEVQGYDAAKINGGFDGQIVVSSVRNNERVIYDSTALADALWPRIQPFVPPMCDGWHASGLNERFRFYKYSPGQQFKLHHDGVYYRSFEEWSCYTFMVYLNDDFLGGETNFPKHAIVKPEAGKALIFKHELLHEGCSVLEGVKYVLRTDVMYKRG